MTEVAMCSISSYRIYVDKHFLLHIYYIIKVYITFCLLEGMIVWPIFLKVIRVKTLNSLSMKEETEVLK